jgi:hypothetical protein
LIDQVGPFLQAQIRSGDDIKSLSDGLARFTSEVRQADPQVRALLAVAPSAAGEANTAFSGIRPSFPMLAASLANLGRVGVIYHKSLEQLLVVLPALFAAITTAAGGAPQDEGAKLDFKIDIDPPPCNTGFIPPPLIRTPADETLREIPTDMYCKVAQNDATTVRGARNYPCQEFPGKRAPTVALCRDPRGYVPIGTNPWRGPPIPYGTPMTNGLNILPPNKFPYIPPGADPDPGTPVAGRLRPARWRGRGRPRISHSRCRRHPTTAGPMAGRRGYRRRPTRRSRRRCLSRKISRRRHRPWGSNPRPKARRPKSRGGRRPVRCRRPAARPTPPTTRAQELSRTRQAALVSSRPADHRAPRTGWT